VNEWGKEDLSNETWLREEEAIEGWGRVGMNTIELGVGKRKFLPDF
jgi:hypothetical protein